MRQIGCTDAIRNRIEAAELGSVFILSDFSDLAEPDAVRKAITRLENDGTLTRIMRGVYYKPESIPVLKLYLKNSKFDNTAFTSYFNHYSFGAYRIIMER